MTTATITFSDGSPQLVVAVPKATSRDSRVTKGQIIWDVDGHSGLADRSKEKLLAQTGAWLAMYLGKAKEESERNKRIDNLVPVLYRLFRGATGLDYDATPGSYGSTYWRMIAREVLDATEKP